MTQHTIDYKAIADAVFIDQITTSRTYDVENDHRHGHQVKLIGESPRSKRLHRRFRRTTTDHTTDNPAFNLANHEIIKTLYYTPQ